jgi:hypothetical protein
MAVRDAMATAQHRDAMDAEIIDLERQVAAMPAVIVGDPGAAMASDLVAWLSRGVVQLTECDVQRARVLGLTIMPAMAGLLLGFWMTLGREL